MNIHELIKTRKSVRSFQDRDIPPDLLERILDTAHFCPSAKNIQEWKFIVVRNPALREKLAEAAKGQTFVGQAPVVLVCCAVKCDYVMTCGQPAYPIDLAIIIDHISLLATAEGLGTCWIGAFYEDKVKTLLGIPPDVRVVQLLPIGYPADPAPVSKSRRPLADLVCRETWS